MRFPLDKKIELDSIPAANRWGARRKFDNHTGVDFFCDPGTPVYAIEDGVVMKIDWFTGAVIDMPWWEDTMAVAIKGKSGVWNYAEIAPHLSLKVGSVVKQGDWVGNVMTVLKKDKGLPMTMLHLELYDDFVADKPWVMWNLNCAAPKGLINPEYILGEKLYNQLTLEARKVADINGWFSDKKIKEVVKDMKITARQDWDIPASTYAKWKPSDFFMAMVDDNRRNPIHGSDSGIGGSML